MKVFTSITALVVSVILLSGCATILTGTSDDVYINSNPEGADILIEGLKVGSTPAIITVTRPGFNEKEIVLELEGYERRAFLLK